MSTSLKSTPDNLTNVEPHQVFVFGSNLQGFHHGGAARCAVERFGAVVGKGVGIQGQSYAIPTMHGLETMKLYIGDFLEYARLNPEREFLVTRIGCGIAGYKDEEVAQMFTLVPDNVILPKGW